MRCDPRLCLLEVHADALCGCSAHTVTMVTGKTATMQLTSGRQARDREHRQAWHTRTHARQRRGGSARGGEREGRDGAWLCTGRGPALARGHAPTVANLMNVEIADADIMPGRYAEHPKAPTLRQSDGRAHMAATGQAAG